MKITDSREVIMALNFRQVPSVLTVVAILFFGPALLAMEKAGEKECPISQCSKNSQKRLEQPHKKKVTHDEGERMAVLVEILKGMGKESVLNDIDKPGFDVNAVITSKGSTLLHMAASAGVYILVKKLVGEKKADLNARNKSNLTPLHFATQSGHREIIKLLLDNNADVNAKGGPHGITCLYAASELGHVEIVELLLSYKADVHATDDENLTPYAIAQRKGNQRIAEILKPLTVPVQTGNVSAPAATVSAAMQTAQASNPAAAANAAMPTAPASKPAAAATASAQTANVSVLAQKNGSPYKADGSKKLGLMYLVQGEGQVIAPAATASISAQAAAPAVAPMAVPMGMPAALTNVPAYTAPNGAVATAVTVPAGVPAAAAAAPTASAQVANVSAPAQNSGSPYRADGSKKLGLMYLVQGEGQAIAPAATASISAQAAAVVPTSVTVFVPEANLLGQMPKNISLQLLQDAVVAQIRAARSDSEELSLLREAKRVKNSPAMLKALEDLDKPEFDVNALIKDDPTKKNGRTLLHEAARYGRFA